MSLSIRQWAMIHTDALHPGSRDDCPHCQEMIRLHGPMPSVEELQRVRVDDPKAKTPKVVIPECLRWEIFERDNFTCQRCGARRWLRVDHIYPESLGGTLDPSNLQTLCRSCNSRKGNRVAEWFEEKSP